MRNRTVREPEEKVHRKIPGLIGGNPFDHADAQWQEVYLHCSECKKPLFEWAFAFRYAAGFNETEQLYDFTRIAPMIERAIKSHPCLANKSFKPERRISESEMMSGRIELPKQHYPGLSLRCSGHGVFVGGEKCPGCSDCQASDELKQLRKEVDILLKADKPKFTQGMWIINTKNGDLKQITAAEATLFNNTPDENIKPYI